MGEDGDENRNPQGFKFATKLAPEFERLRQAAEAGFKAAEFWLNGEMLGKAATIASCAKNFSMHYAMHFPNRGNLSSERLWNTVWLYRELEANAIVAHEAMFEKYGTSLIRLDPNVRLAIENGRQRGSEFQRWAESNHWLTLDIEHFWKYTHNDCPLPELIERLADFFARFGEKVRHIHLPGAIPGTPEHQPLHHNRELALRVFNLLVGVNYGGFVVSELNQEFQTPDNLERDVSLHTSWLEDYPSAAENWFLSPGHGELQEEGEEAVLPRAS